MNTSEVATTTTTFQVIKRFPRQNAHTTIKSYKSRSGAVAFVAKNLTKGYEVLTLKG